jgi:hypothetical protein
MRCPDCNKFVSLELADEPEAELEVSEGVVSGTVRLVRQCADCGTELKEASFDVEVSLPTLVEHAAEVAAKREEREKERKEKEDEAKATGKEIADEDEDEDDEHEMEVDVDESQGTEEGGGRWKKSFFGVEVTFTAKCSCGKEEQGNFEDKIAASHMDEIA